MPGELPRVLDTRAFGAEMVIRPLVPAGGKGKDDWVRVADPGWEGSGVRREQ
jgi:hypothetical protein